MTSSPKNGIEFAIITAFLAAFVLLNVLTAAYHPTVWTDEVSYADPAANLYLGHGFTSTAWYAQPGDHFWAGNVPLYGWTLSLWYRIFGFGIVATRSMSYFLAAVAGFLFWLGLYRFKMFGSATNRLIFLMAALLASATMFTYRFTRPDSLSLVMAATCFLACSLKSARMTALLLFLAGVCSTFTGLSLVFYYAVLGCLLLLFDLKYFWKLFALMGGCVTGALGLFILYRSQGVWGEFIASVLPHLTGGGSGSPGADPNYSLPPLHGSPAREVVAKVAGLLLRIYNDRSTLVVLAVGLGMLVSRLSTRSFRFRSPLVFGLMCILCIPFGMQIVAKYPAYYRWMSFFPGITAIAFEACRSMKPFTRWWSLPICVLVAFAGMPGHLLYCFADHEPRSYYNLESAISPAIQKDDVAFIDFEAYYAVKTRASAVYMPMHLVKLNEAQKRRINVAVTAEGRLDFLNETFGPGWHVTPFIFREAPKPKLLGITDHSNQHSYDLQVYRRD